MNLKDKLKTIKPRENAGSIASNRFDFQKNWAICKLIELSNQNEDFILAFEFHEDIIVFDSSDNPNFIDFYQIKTKNSGKFNLSALLKKQLQKKGDGSSILGKLFNNKLNFEEETRSLNLVSNTFFSFKDVQNSKKGNICCDELRFEEKELITKAINSELKVSSIKDFIKLMNFNVTDLTIEHHNEITSSKLNKLIEQKFTADIKYNPSLAYRTIFDEINRRNNIEKIPSNFEELVKYKAVTKDDFDKFLNIVITEPNKIALLKSKIFNVLDNNGINTAERTKLNSSWKDIEIELLKINNSFFDKTKNITHKIINDNQHLLNTNIINSIDVLYVQLLKNNTILKQNIYSEYFLKLLILIEIYNE